MSLLLTFQKSRAKKRKGAKGTYYIEGKDHRGNRVHKSLKTSDRDRAQRAFADYVAKTVALQQDGPAAVANFADAVVLYGERKGENSNAPYLDAMLPLIGKTRLCDLTQADLDGLARKLYPNRSRASIKRHVYTPFCAVWKEATRGENPLCQKREWIVPAVPKRAPPKPPSDGEIAELTSSGLDAGRGKRNAPTGSRNRLRDECAVMFITLTGARSGEAQRVALSHVNLDAGNVLLRRTKNGKARQVAMPPMLIELVGKLYTLRREEGAGDADLLFRFKTRWGLPQMVKRAQRRAKLTEYRPHEIGRHAFAGRLLAQGASTLDVQRAGGWDTAKMVDQYYGHLAEEHVDRVVSGVSTAGFQKPTRNLHAIDSEAPETPGNIEKKRA